MPKLSDLIDVGINRNTVSIQGAAIPILFTMETFNHVQEAYGATYSVFEKDLNKMLSKRERLRLNAKEMKVMYALIYGMIVSGGTDCTLEDIRGGIPIGDLQEIFQKVLDIFQNQDFQKSDIERMKQGDSKK